MTVVNTAVFVDMETVDGERGGKVEWERGIVEKKEMERKSN